MYDGSVEHWDVIALHTRRRTRPCNFHLQGLQCISITGTVQYHLHGPGPSHERARRPCKTTMLGKCGDPAE
jgi:hypothetical protein